MDRRLLLRLFGVVGAAAAIPAPMLMRMRELADVPTRRSTGRSCSTTRRRRSWSPVTWTRRPAAPLQGVDQVASGGVTGRLTRFYGLREQMPDDLPVVAELDDRLAAVA